MSAAAISKLVADKVAEALEADHAARNNQNVVGGSGGNGGQCGASPVRECTFTGFMKCGPTQFHGNEGAVELCHWFEKTESVFGISECAERSKVKFAAATLQEVQRLENELMNLKLRDTNITAYTQRFNELALLCPEAVPTEKKKVKLYIKGLSENIKGETTSSRPVVLSEVVCMAHTLMEQKIQDKAERVAENNKRKWESNNNQSGNNNINNYRDNTRHHQHNNRRQGNARAMTTAQLNKVDMPETSPFATVVGSITPYEVGRNDTRETFVQRGTNPQGVKLHEKRMQSGKPIRSRMLWRRHGPWKTDLTDLNYAVFPKNPFLLHQQERSEQPKRLDEIWSKRIMVKDAMVEIWSKTPMVKTQWSRTQCFKNAMRLGNASGVERKRDVERGLVSEGGGKRGSGQVAIGKKEDI
ncbi:putative reverse transcriptase domain-containing protein [Tanacetum coccineum]